MNFRWKKWLYYLGIGVGLLLFSRQVWLAIQAIRQQTVSSYKPVYLIAALGMVFLAYTLQTLAWGQIMKGQDVSLNVLTMLQSYAVSLLPRYIPGTIWGYLSRSEWLKVNYCVPRAKSNAGSVFEVALVVLTACAIAVAYYSWLIFPERGRLFIIVGVLVIPWTVWYSSRKILAVPALRKLNKFSLTLNLRYWFNGYLIYLTMWVCYGLSLLWLLYAFDIQFNGNVVNTTYIMAVSWLSGFVVLIVPSGLGVREFTLYTLLIAQTTDLNETISIVAVASRLLIYVVEIVWLVLRFGLAPINQKEAITRIK